VWGLPQLPAYVLMLCLIAGYSELSVLKTALERSVIQPGGRSSRTRITRALRLDMDIGSGANNFMATRAVNMSRWVRFAMSVLSLVPYEKVRTVRVCSEGNLPTCLEGLLNGTRLRHVSFLPSVYCIAVYRIGPYHRIKSKLLSQSVSLGIEHPCGTCDQILLPV
jgi:hypothetical protein